MVLGRRELGAILLGIVAIVFYLVLLSATPSGAQSGGDCPGAQEIDSFTGNGNQSTAPFQTSSNPFRVSYETTSEDPSGFLSISVTAQGGDFSVENASQEGTGTGQTFVNEPAGSYFLEIVAVGVDYTITVENCTGGGNNNGNGTTSGNNNQNRTQYDNNNNNNQNGNQTTPDQNPPNQQPRTQQVINVPNKPLPPSGGLPVYSVVAGFVLTGAGLLALGFGIRRSSSQR